MVSKVLNKVYKRIEKFIGPIVRHVSCLFFLKKKYIVLNGFFSQYYTKVINNNLGDDINIPLIEELTGKKVLILDNLSKSNRITNLMAIGSLIDFFCTSNSIIWGSGILEGKRPLQQNPKKVCAVRGVYSRSYLLKNGINCPEVYGDPALLMPLIYKSELTKKYKIGIIPHYVDDSLELLVKFKESNPNILFIKFRDYSHWQDVIDEINSCEVIFSSSLHGLILSDAYGIPNVHVKFSNNIRGGNLKYKDYFSGVNREYREPLDFTHDINIEKALDVVKVYKPIDYDFKKLLKAFPYTLADTYSQLI